MRWLYQSAYPGVVGMVVAVALAALADSGGAWWVFAFSAGQVMVALSWENWHLKDAVKPRLTLRFDRDHAPFVRDKPAVDSVTKQPAGTLRIFSVGVTNSGDTAHGVSVRIVKIEPTELAQYWSSALHVANKKVKVGKRDIHHSPKQPVAWFEVVAHSFDHGPSNSISVRFAGEALFGRPLAGSDKYFITVAIDGPGAGPPVRYVVSRDWQGRYVMNRAIKQPEVKP